MTGTAEFNRPWPTAFSELDREPDPKFFVAMMDEFQQETGVEAVRRRALTELELRPGQRVLDVGCGSGQVTMEIARHVAPGGHAVGVDFSEVMVEEAARRAKASGVEARFETGDVRRLRFDDGSFDACRAERLLSHLDQGAVAVTEMARVVRPGGRVVLVDSDGDSLLIDGQDRTLTRAFVESCGGAVANPWAGRQLRTLMRRAGLSNVTVSGMIVDVPLDVLAPFLDDPDLLVERTGVADAGRWRQWSEAIHAADRAGDLYLAAPMFIAVGIR